MAAKSSRAATTAIIDVTVIGRDRLDVFGERQQRNG